MQVICSVVRHNFHFTTISYILLNTKYNCENIMTYIFNPLKLKVMKMKLNLSPYRKENTILLHHLVNANKVTAVYTENHMKPTHTKWRGTDC
jgi:hypothetical protein